MSRFIEFWFEFASTYSYPAAARVEPIAALLGVSVVWKPFLLGPIFRAQGWEDSPFNLFPTKGRYMWRDVERVCEKHRLPFRQPSAFPRRGLLAGRVACVAAHEGWAGDFVPAVYRANFGHDQDIADPEVIAGIVRSVGRDPEAALDAAQAESVKATLRINTEEAAERGLFGAPSFMVGGELFWGHDRLEDALAWACRA